MAWISSLMNSFVFWAAWIVIPILMEIIPSLGSVFVLVKKHFMKKKSEPLAIDPEISLIIPVYNSMNTLEACIRSIDESDYPNECMRIFLVNNQGQDDSFSVFCECQDKFPDLKMQWLNAMQGKSKALNLALFNSEGKYIIHIDSDGTLEPHAIRNTVEKFENNQDVDCVTGAILTDPKQVEEFTWLFPKLIRKMEFLEYAQAFLAGRNYASELNSIYTLSGAFSAFRKSAVLKSQLYNTDTICEDTQITFQMRYLLGKKIKICENAIFFVDPIEDMDRLYTQRQRWQRGSLEVSNLFLKDKMKARNMFSNVNVRTLLYDHTFAFPRLIWYLALVCLLAMNYSFKLIGISTIMIYVLYVVIGYFYFFSTIGFLKEFKELRKYYSKQWYIVPFLPLFNLAMFFVRFAGVINSINTNSAWKTKTFTQEKQDIKKTMRDDFKGIRRFRRKLQRLANEDE